MKLGAVLSRGRALLGIFHGSRAFGGPIQMNIAITGRCNIRCIHCYCFSPLVANAYNRGNRLALKTGAPVETFKALGKDVDGQALRRVVAEAMSLGTKQFLLSGLGEPLLHPVLPDLIADIKQRQGQCTINTNGTLLTPQMADEFIRLGVDELRITVMAGTPEGYQATHPGSPARVFTGLKENIAYLTKRRNELGRTAPQISIVSVITAANCGEIPALADLAIATGADRILLRAFEHCEDEQLKKLIVSEDQALHIREALAACRPLLEKNRIKHNIGHFLSIFSRQVGTAGLYKAIPCYFGWLNANIDIDGSVYLCCKCYEPVGNIHESSFREIWYGEKFQKFRAAAKRINRGGQRLPCECARCANYEPNTRVFQLLHPVAWTGVKDTIDRTSAECSS